MRSARPDDKGGSGGFYKTQRAKRKETQQSQRDNRQHTSGEGSRSYTILASRVPVIPTETRERERAGTRQRFLYSPLRILTCIRHGRCARHRHHHHCPVAVGGSSLLWLFYHRFVSFVSFFLCVCVCVLVTVTENGERRTTTQRNEAVGRGDRETEGQRERERGRKAGLVLPMWSYSPSSLSPSPSLSLPSPLSRARLAVFGLTSLLCETTINEVK